MLRIVGLSLVVLGGIWAYQNESSALYVFAGGGICMAYSWIKARKKKARLSDPLTNRYKMSNLDTYSMVELLHNETINAVIGRERNDIHGSNWAN